MLISGGDVRPDMSSLSRLDDNSGGSCLGGVDVVGVVSRSSITKSIGILPFKQPIYLWQKLSQSSCTFSSSNKWNRRTWIACTIWNRDMYRPEDDAGVTHSIADINKTSNTDIHIKFSVRKLIMCCAEGYITWKQCHLQAHLARGLLRKTAFLPLPETL